MHISTSGSSSLTAGPGMIYVPLFLIESVLSIIGYFLIQYVVGLLLKKWTSKGDRVGCYFLWYGLVRFILEPFRDSNFNMGTDNAWSICNSLIYVLLGVAIIAAAHLHDYYVKNKKGDFFPLVSAGLLLPTFLFPLLPSLTTSSMRDGEGEIHSYGGYQLISKGETPLFLAAFILLLVATLVFVASYFVLKKSKKAGYYCLLAGAALSFIGTMLYIFGKNVNHFDEKLYVNLSYGFVLSAAFAFMALSIALIYLKDTKSLGKEEEKAHA